MLEAHEDIRRFTAIAVQLGHALDSSLPELSEAAERVLHYFTRELPVHLLEEDEALLPRLFTTELPAEMFQHLWELERQHEAFELLLEELVPLWRAVRDTPGHYAQLVGRLARAGRRLMTMMEEHITLEERILFPFIRSHLSLHTREELAAELLFQRRAFQAGTPPGRAPIRDLLDTESQLSS
jgi:iron-sulfur cluster repair protein YtfE (RIC family)